MNARHIYKNPPIKEALCEFRFAGEPRWGLDTASTIASSLSSRYDAEPVLAHQSGMDIRGTEGEAGIRLGDAVPVLELRDIAGSSRLVVKPGALSVHALRPYKSWDEFRPLILDALHVCLDPLGGQQISRIGLRYINELFVPSSQIELREYVRDAPDFPEGSPATQIHGFLQRLEGLDDERGIKLIQTIAGTPAEPGHVGVIVDLDAIKEFPDPSLHPDDAATVLDDIRDFEREAFEALMTERSRELFDG